MKSKTKYCDCGYEMINNHWYSFCSKCLKSVDNTGFRAWLIRLVIRSYGLKP